ncbi:hypothetical protein PS2_017552 [Malus domestica]
MWSLCNYTELLKAASRKLVFAAKAHSVSTMAAISYTSWYRLNDEKDDWIIYVTDVGQQQHFDMLLKAAKHAGYPTDGALKPKITHVGFGLVFGEDGAK